MQEIDYIDIPQQEGDESRLDCVSLNVAPPALATLGEMYRLDGALDQISGFKGAPLRDLRAYFVQIDGPGSQFRTHNHEMIDGARMALHLAAFRDARKGIIWPQQDKAPLKTFYSHPWEHRSPWNQRADTYYPAVRPTGATLDYTRQEQAPGHPLRRFFSAGQENLRYKLEEVSPASLATGLRTIADAMRLARGTNNEILDYYFANREELRGLARQHFNPEKMWESWRASYSLNDRLNEEIRERGTLGQRFIFPVSAGITLNIGRELGVDETVKYLEGFEGNEYRRIVDALLYFAAIDLSLSEDVPEFPHGSAWEVAHSTEAREHFRQCYDDYGAYLTCAKTALDGYAFPGHGPRRLHEYEIYALLTHLVLFEAADLMYPKDCDPHSTSLHRDGERYVYVEDLAERVQAMGIDLRYMENFVVEMNEYFQSLGLRLVRRSGQETLDRSLIETWRRLNDFFRSNPVVGERDLIRARLLSEIPKTRLT